MMDRILPAFVELTRFRGHLNNWQRSFFATLECECIDHEGPFPTQAEARLAVFRFIEGWYNPHRRHSALSYLSPRAFEAATVTVDDAELRGTPQVWVRERSPLLRALTRSKLEPTDLDRRSEPDEPN